MIIDQFLANSNCATEKHEKEYLRKILGDKLLITTLLYQASIHGWKPVNFHYRSKSKSPTVCLLKIKEGDCIGGYTKVYWSPDEREEDDFDAMLFNLSCCRNFPSK
jgi:hypothetical protein